ncbi:organelle RRM domain-containing protein 6, chloroplastic-like protein [Tanacetum coccineum]
MAASVCISSSSSLLLLNKCPKLNNNNKKKLQQYNCRFSSHLTPPLNNNNNLSTSLSKHHHNSIVACLPSSQQQHNKNNNALFTNKLYVSGLSFRTTEESLRNAFQSFGQLIEVNLVMDKIANRPRGFAFLRYATKEESDKAIEGMHGKWELAMATLVGYVKDTDHWAARGSTFLFGTTKDSSL